MEIQFNAFGSTMSIVLDEYNELCTCKEIPPCTLHLSINSEIQTEDIRILM